MSTPRLSIAAMSLIEVMIASTILVLAVSAGMGAIGSSSVTSIHRQNIDRAMAAMQSKVETFQAMDNQTLQSQFANVTGDSVYFPVQGLSPGTNPSTGTVMPQPLLVQRVRVVNGIQLTTLRFLVAWTDAAGTASVEQFLHFTDRR